MTYFSSFLLFQLYLYATLVSVFENIVKSHSHMLLPAVHSDLQST